MAVVSNVRISKLYLLEANGSLQVHVNSSITTMRVRYPSYMTTTNKKRKQNHKSGKESILARIV